MSIKKFFEDTFFKKEKGPRYKNFRKVPSFLDVPDDPMDIIYIVSSGEFNKWVIFKCPNKCGKRVEVNLMESRFPRWNVTVKKGKVSLYPSLVVVECGAHFWLFKNKVKWAFFENDI